MTMTVSVHLGIDVGGTNTDAAVLQENKVIGHYKHVTTTDVTSGVIGAVKEALSNAEVTLKPVNTGMYHDKYKFI